MTRRVKKKPAVAPKKSAPQQRKPASNEPKLNDEARREKFCHEYLIDYVGSAACLRAGFKAKNANVAAVLAHRLLREAKVKTRISELESECLEALRVEKFRLVREQSRVAFADPARAVDRKSGAVKPLHKMDADIRGAVASIEVFEEFEGTGSARKKIGQTVKLRFWDKNQASANLMRHKGLYEKDNKQKSDVLKELLEAIDGKSTGLPNRGN